MNNATKKIPIVLATWPEKQGALYFGHVDHIGHVEDCDSFWLKFRPLKAADGAAWLHEDERAVSDIGMYVWFNSKGAIQTYFAIREAGTLQLNEAELRLKTLRWFAKRMPDTSERNAASFRPFLFDVFKAIGVGRALEYRFSRPGLNSDLVPIYDAVEVIGKEFDRRYNALKGST